MARIIGDTIGRIMQVLWHDGTDFRLPQCDSSGHLLAHDLDLQTLVRYNQLRRINQVWKSNKTDTASSGNIALSSDTVPSGYFLVVCVIATYIYAGSSAYIMLRASLGGTDTTFNLDPSPTVNVPLCYSGAMVLDEADYLQATAYSVGANTSFALRGIGYLVEKAP